MALTIEPAVDFRLNRPAQPNRPFASHARSSGVSRPSPVVRMAEMPSLEWLQWSGEATDERRTRSGFG